MPSTNWILKTKHLLSPTCFWPWWTESFLPDSSDSSLRGLGSGRFVLIFVIPFSQNQTLSLWGGLSLWRVGQASSSPCLAPAPCHLHIRVPVLLPEPPQLGIAIIGDLDLLQKSIEILFSKLRNFQQLTSSSRYKITNDSPYTGISASPYSQYSGSKCSFLTQKKCLEIQWNFVGTSVYVRRAYIPNFSSLGDREHSRRVRNWFWKISLVKVLGFWLFFKDCAFTAI